MKKFIQEFKAFALRGNVMDMAIGVLIGAAFSGIVGREPVPVEGRVRAILRRFLHAVRLPLARLFDGACSRSEIVATFLAVLELSRTHRIRLHGEGEDIELTLNDEKGSETRDTTGEHA